MREQRLLDLCMQCVGAPLKKGGLFSGGDVTGGHKPLQMMCKLSQRLCWHMLRQCNANRVYASRCVSDASTPPAEPARRDGGG